MVLIRFWANRLEVDPTQRMRISVLASYVRANSTRGAKKVPHQPMRWISKSHGQRHISYRAKAPPVRVSMAPPKLTVVPPHPL